MVKISELPIPTPQSVKQTASSMEPTALYQHVPAPQRASQPDSRAYLWSLWTSYFNWIRSFVIDASTFNVRAFATDQFRRFSELFTERVEANFLSSYWNGLEDQLQRQFDELNGITPPAIIDQPIKTAHMMPTAYKAAKIGWLLAIATYYGDDPSSRTLLGFNAPRLYNDAQDLARKTTGVRLTLEDSFPSTGAKFVYQNALMFIAVSVNTVVTDLAASLLLPEDSSFPLYAAGRTITGITLYIADKPAIAEKIKRHPLCRATLNPVLNPAVKAIDNFRPYVVNQMQLAILNSWHKVIGAVGQPAYALIHTEKLFLECAKHSSQPAFIKGAHAVRYVRRNILGGISDGLKKIDKEVQPIFKQFGYNFALGSITEATAETMNRSSRAIAEGIFSVTSGTIKYAIERTFAQKLPLSGAFRLFTWNSTKETTVQTVALNLFSGSWYYAHHAEKFPFERALLLRYTVLFVIYFARIVIEENLRFTDKLIELDIGEETVSKASVDLSKRIALLTKESSEEEKLVVQRVAEELQVEINHAQHSVDSVTANKTAYSKDENEAAERLDNVIKQANALLAKYKKNKAILPVPNKFGFYVRAAQKAFQCAMDILPRIMPSKNNSIAASIVRTKMEARTAAENLENIVQVLSNINREDFNDVFAKLRSAYTIEQLHEHGKNKAAEAKRVLRKLERLGKESDKEAINLKIALSNYEYFLKE